MNRTKYLIVVALVAFAATACQPGSNTTVNNAVAANTNAGSNSNSNSNATSTAAAPTKEALVALERSAYDAWKNKDAKFWDTFLAANFVGFGSTGKLDKASASKEYAGADCEVKSSTISDEQMRPLGPDAALLTYKLAQDATCGGQKLPANAWAAGVYVREGGQWKGAFHAEMPIRDPKAAPATGTAPAAKPAATNAAASPAANPNTDALAALERKAWDAWKNKDAKALEDWAGAGFVAFTSNGRQDKAGAIKTWTTDGCQVRSTGINDPASVSFGPDFSLLTFRSAIDATCGGSPVPSEYGATIYGKEAGAWKAVFTMGSPIM